MDQVEMVAVKCHCCDTVDTFPKHIIARAKNPSFFCDRCFEMYDSLTLRKWFVMDMLANQVQAISDFLHRQTRPDGA